MAQALARVGDAVRRIFGPREKQLMEPGYLLPLGGGFIPASWPINYWQTGRDPLPYGTSAVVYACRSAYSQTLAMLPPAHWQSDGKGGRTRVTTSALSRVLRRPNSYQSPSDFFLYAADCLYGQGAVFGLGLRNARFEISELHLFDPRMCSVSVGLNGELFYQLAGNEIVERQFSGNRAALQQVPARDVLHIRFPDPRNPLRGIPPVEAAMLEMAASQAGIAQSLTYASNSGRPSGVLETDADNIDTEKLTWLRQKYDEQTKGVNAGGTPILTHGLKWRAGVVPARDMQMAEIVQMSDARIATAYRVPPPLLSLWVTQGGTGTQSSNEALMQFWASTGLGFAANHFEDGFGRLFQLAGWPDDYMEMDMAALLRAAYRDRIEGLARGVQGGIYSPNEARALEDLPAMPFGEEPRLQQQVVPLSAWDQVKNPPPSTPRPDAPAAPPPAGGQPNDGTGNSARELAQLIRNAADRYDRAA